MREQNTNHLWKINLDMLLSKETLIVIRIKCEKLRTRYKVLINLLIQIKCI